MKRELIDFGRKVSSSPRYITGLCKKVTSSTKYFCISMQRSGTTSVGEFFEQKSLRTARYSNFANWTYFWYQGDFKKIFTNYFYYYDAFEDDPWWCPDFYRYVAANIPNSRFILLTRPAEDWWESMLSHSNGRSLGNTLVFSTIYRQLPNNSEAKLIMQSGMNEKNGAMPLDNLMTLTNDKFMKNIYLSHNKSAELFFNQSPELRERLFIGNLYDDDIWNRLNDWMGFQDEKFLHFHAHKS